MNWPRLNFMLIFCLRIWIKKKLKNLLTKLFLFIWTTFSSISVASAKIQMQTYIVASAPVILYVDQLFHSRNLGVDWWNTLYNEFIRLVFLLSLNICISMSLGKVDRIFIVIYLLLQSCILQYNKSCCICICSLEFSQRRI